jgi:DNA-binding transcriptional LysR family regulator
LVRAGRGLVPTPRAVELREQVRQLVQDSESVLRPVEKLDIKNLVRSFTLRTSEGFAETFGPALILRVGEEAPAVRLCFIQKPDKGSTGLRSGAIDLETGVVEKTTAPELRVQALFRDRYVGAVRKGHSLSEGQITPSRYAAGRHISVSRDLLDKGPIDDALLVLGLERKVVTIVGGFSTALGLARASEMIASVPERHTESLRADMHCFPLPVTLPEFTVSLPSTSLAPWPHQGCLRDAPVKVVTALSFLIEAHPDFLAVYL